MMMGDVYSSANYVIAWLGRAGIDARDISNYNPALCQLSNASLIRHWVTDSTTLDSTSTLASCGRIPKHGSIIRIPTDGNGLVVYGSFRK